jgi:tRNA uracil 4-sulfurtransferase
MNALIIRYGELALKGKNRNLFEKQLRNNISAFLTKQCSEELSVSYVRGRMFIDGIPDSFHDLKKVFGISSFSPAKILPLEIDAIKESIFPYLDIVKNKSFRVSVNRVDKSLPFCSMSAERELGSFIVSETGASVNLKNFDINLQFEFIDGRCFFYYEKYYGMDGLPLGSQDPLHCYIEDKWGILATLLVMRRGCPVHLLCKKGFSYDIIFSYSVGYSFPVTEVDSFEECIPLIDNNPLVIGVIEISDLELYYLSFEDIIILNPLIGLTLEEAEEKLVMFS